MVQVSLPKVEQAHSLFWNRFGFLFD